jgi:hypothetical protein
MYEMHPALFLKTECDSMYIEMQKL